MSPLLLAAALLLADPPAPSGFITPGADPHVAEALYLDPLTSAAIARDGDARIEALNARVLDLASDVRAGTASEAQLAEAEEALIAALSGKDPDYAAKIGARRTALLNGPPLASQLPAAGRALGGAFDNAFGRSGFGANRVPSRTEGDTAAEARQEAEQEREAVARREAERASEAERGRRFEAEERGMAADGALDTSAAPAAAAPPVRGLPAFPWPPPTPSERLNLTRAQILPANLRRRPSLGDVGDRIVAALQAAGYSEFSFYSAPRGFAIVARLERIEPDGTPAPQQLRFLAPDAAQPFSLMTYVTRLFFAPEGYYRQIVFAVTTEMIRPSGPMPNAKAAEALLEGGADRLPAALRAMPFTPDYQVAALIYEYRKGPEAMDVKTLNPGRLDARTNLVRAGIYRWLVAARN